MENCWSVYHCDLIEPREIGLDGASLPKAIRIDRSKVFQEAIALPKGFTTKVLLGFDFSDDDQVLEFVNKYGIVMCPYGGEIDRTLGSIEDPFVCQRLLHRIVEQRSGGEEGKSGLRNWLAGFLERGLPRSGKPKSELIDPSMAFTGCDADWDATRVVYEGLHESLESNYLQAANRGFVNLFKEDDKLVGTERLRAAAVNKAVRQHAETRVWEAPDCLISLEEVRANLYLSQVAAVVLHGFSYVSNSVDGKRITGIQANRLARSVISGSEREKKVDGKREAAMQAYEQRIASRQQIERLYGLFFQGRPNLIRALRAVRPWSLTLPGVESEAAEIAMPDVGGLTIDEKERADRRLAEARESWRDDSDALALLDLHPNWMGWKTFQSDLAIYVTACLTSCWSSAGHHLVEEESLRVGDPDGDQAYIVAGSNRMTLQRAIAQQIVEHLDNARIGRDLPEKDRMSAFGKNPVWKICSQCGSLYQFRSTTNRLVLEGEEKPRRKNFPVEDTCSDACRKRKARSQTGRGQSSAC